MSGVVRLLCSGLLVVCLFDVSLAYAQPPAAEEEDKAELAKKLSNPIADLVSLPFQLNWEQGVGPDDQTRFILNIQPVMPFSLSPDWTMIARVIVPLVSQPPLTADGVPAFGVGDILTSLFFSPAKSGKFMWGAGPAISLPSSAFETIGSEKWSIGPTVVILKQTGPWTFGALWNQIWSFAGNKVRGDVNQMFLQPFLAYNTKNLYTFTLQSESTANWNADGDTWTVPINVVVSKLSSFGPFPASFAIGVGAFAASPDVGGADWKLRAALTILLPRKR